MLLVEFDDERLQILPNPYYPLKIFSHFPLPFHWWGFHKKGFTRCILHHFTLRSDLSLGYNRDMYVHAKFHPIVYNRWHPQAPVRTVHHLTFSSALGYERPLPILHHPLSMPHP